MSKKKRKKKAYVQTLESIATEIDAAMTEEFLHGSQACSYDPGPCKGDLRLRLRFIKKKWQWAVQAYGEFTFDVWSARVSFERYLATGECRTFEDAAEKGRRELQREIDRRTADSLFRDSDESTTVYHYPES